MTWLVAEDEENDFLLLRRACRRLEPEPVLFRVKDGMEAVNYLSGRTAGRVLPELILADLKMPRMNGLELLAWCKRDAVLRKVPFIMLTSSNADQDRSKAAELGVDEYLVKPASLNEFARMMTAAVSDRCAKGKSDQNEPSESSGCGDKWSGR
jgi:two-component system, chemotaxis family, response regulator Rcp1